MAIAQKLESKTKEYAVQIKNLQSDISSYQTADSGLQVISDNIGALRELSVKYKNDTLSADERSSIEAEAESILSDIDKSASDTQYNTGKLLTNYSAEDLGLRDVSLSDEGMTEKLDSALKNISNGRTDLGAKIKSSEEEAIKLTVANENSAAASSKIVDADMLLSMMDNTKNKILQEADTAVNAQALISQQRAMDVLKD